MAAVKKRDIQLQHAIDKRMVAKNAKAQGVLFKKDLEAEAMAEAEGSEDDDLEYDDEDSNSEGGDSMDSEEREWDRAAKQEIKRR